MKKNIQSHIIATAAMAAFAVIPAAAYTSVDNGITPQFLSPLSKGYLDRGLEMVTQGNLTGAIDQLGAIDLSLVPDTEREEIFFSLAHASYLRGDAGCVPVLERFVALYPASKHSLEARLLCADYYFFAHEYADALVRYRDIDLSQLGSAERAEYTYREALSMINCGYFDEAQGLLDSLRGNKRFDDAVTYYTAYIDYVEKRYDDAYRGFSSMPDEGNAGASRRAKRDYISDGFEPGYYLTQIDFLRGDYDNVIRNGRSLLAKRPVQQLVPETQRVVGESYFKTGQSAVARQYLENYLDSAGDDAYPSAIYALATILYNDGEYSRAEQLFDRLTDLNDEIAQSAWLYIGQCAVRENNDRQATIAFEKAYRLNYDPKIAELAHYNYASALLRGGNVPFRSSVDALESFVDRYPRSKYASEVRSALGDVYCREGDYSTALKYLSQIANPSAETLQLKQKALFQLGVEEVSNGRYAEAVPHLRQAADMVSASRGLAIQSRLWLGDALYALKKYAEAEKAYNTFTASGKQTANYALGIYNRAYALYQQNKFAAAEPLFKEAASASSLTRQQQENALLRQADCLFYTARYSAAKAVYAKVIAQNSYGADYASLRHATILGLNGDINGKLNELRSLQQRYPGTSWDAASLLEQGTTLSGAGRTEEAQSVYQQLADSHPDREEARKGLINLALNYSKQGMTDKAIEAYRRVIEQWPSSREAELANEDLAMIYADRGQLTEYSAWLDSIEGAPRLTVDEMERLAFEAAENAIDANPADTRRLEQYISQYPNGSNVAQALFDMAKAQADTDNFSSSVATIDRLLNTRPDAPQVPEALLLKAETLEMHLNDMQQAYDTYKSLYNRGNRDFEIEAMAGMMRTASKPAEQLRLAQNILEQGADSELSEQAAFYEAEALTHTGKGKEGAAALKKLAANPKSLYGARAAVALGQWQLDNKQLSAAEKTLSDFTDSGTPHDYWLARGFITLADVYAAQGKKSLAKEYLISLRDNYPGDETDILQMIKSRLSKL